MPHSAGTDSSYAAAPDRHRRCNRLWIAALAAALCATTATTVHKLLQGRSAFLRWRPKIQQLLEGENVYESVGYPNPPIMAISLYPLTLVPPLAGALLWFALKVAMAAAATFWALELARGRDRRLPTWGVALVLLLTLRPLIEDLQHGNVNILIVFLVMGSLYAFSRGRDARAGLALGLAVSYKVTPALFIPYFLYKKCWAMLGWSVAGLVLFLGVLPSLVLGFAFNVECLGSWFDSMIRPYALRGAVTSTLEINHSLPAVFFRLLTESPGIRIGRGEPIYVNVASIDLDSARILVRLLLLGLLGWLAWLCRATLVDRRDWRLACEFGAVLVAMLLISSWSWKHHYVTLVLPYACLVTYLVHRAHTRSARRWLVAVMAASFLSMLSTSVDVTGWMYRVDGERAAHSYAEAFGMYLLSALVVLAALAELLRRSALRARRAAP